jgi:hypothetical protein
VTPVLGHAEEPKMKDVFAVPYKLIIFALFDFDIHDSAKHMKDMNKKYLILFTECLVLEKTASLLS